MKKCNCLKSLLLVVFMLPLSFLSAEEINSMSVFLNGESEPQAIIIDEIYKIVFPSDDEMVVNTQSSDVNFLIDDVRVITFSASLPTTIETNIAEEENVCITYYAQSHKVSITSDRPLNSIQIYNLQGRCMYTQFLNNKNWDVNISGYAKGIYMVVVQVGNEIEVKKIIK